MPLQIYQYTGADFGHAYEVCQTKVYANIFVSTKYNSCVLHGSKYIIHITFMSSQALLLVLWRQQIMHIDQPLLNSQGANPMGYRAFSGAEK